MSETDAPKIVFNRFLGNRVSVADLRTRNRRRSPHDLLRELFFLVWVVLPNTSGMSRYAQIAARRGHYLVFARIYMFSDEKMSKD